MRKVAIEEIAKDIDFLKTSQLSSYRNPYDGMCAHFAWVEDIGKTRLSDLLYRRYIFLNGEWSFQGIFLGTNRFAQQQENGS